MKTKVVLALCVMVLIFLNIRGFVFREKDDVAKIISSTKSRLVLEKEKKRAGGSDGLLSELYTIGVGRGRDGWDELKEYLEGKSNQEKLNLIVPYVAGWTYSSRSEEEVLNWAKSLEDPQLRMMALDTVFTTWNQKEDYEPFRYVKELSQFKSRSWSTGLLIDALGHCAEENAELALETLTDLNSSEDVYFRAQSKILITLGGSDPQYMLELMRQYELPRNEGGYLRDITFTIASKDLDAGVQLMEVSGQALDEQSVGLFVGSFLERDPDKVIEVLSENPKKNEIVAQRVGRWINNNPEHFIEWIGRQEDEMFSDVSSSSDVLRSLTNVAPESALTVIDSSRFPSEKRESSLTTVLGTWARNDPQKSLKWLEGLSAEEQSVLLPLYVEVVDSISPNLARSFLENSSIER